MASILGLLQGVDLRDGESSRLREWLAGNHAGQFGDSAGLIPV